MTAADIEARRDAIFVRLAELGDMLDLSEDGASLAITSQRASLMEELKLLDDQKQRIDAGRVHTYYGRAI
jgi:hypothetical protein